MTTARKKNGGVTSFSYDFACIYWVSDDELRVQHTFNEQSVRPSTRQYVPALAPGLHLRRPWKRSAIYKNKPVSTQTGNIGGRWRPRSISGITQYRLLAAAGQQRPDGTARARTAPHAQKKVARSRVRSAAELGGGAAEIKRSQASGEMGISSPRQPKVQVA
jgi:hypothetical protein